MRLKSNLYKDSYGNIFFSKTIQGERIVLPAHTKNPNTANKLHSLLEYHALKQFYEPKPKIKHIGFSKLVTKFLNEKHDWTPKTRETYEYILKTYAKTTCLPDNRATADGFKRRVNVVLNWGKKHGYSTDIKKFSLGKPVPRHRVFHTKELNIILSKFKNRDFQRFVQFAYYTGARRGEIHHLKEGQIMGNRMQVFGKTGERYIKLNEQAKKVLEKKRTLWQYKTDYVSKTFKKNCRRLGITNARFHDLRRTFGLNLIKKGMPIFQVSKLLGHSTVKTTEQHYAPLLIEDIEDFSI